MTAIITAQERTQSRLKDLADALAAAVAVSLPWSTSATGILIGIWLVALIPALRRDDLSDMIAKPAVYLPVALFVFGALGMLWSDAAFAERLRALSGFSKLLVLPLLFVQFRRSARGHWVLAGFLVSCGALLVVSTGSFLWPTFPVWSWGKMPGVPVKDYLIQSTLFVVSAFILVCLAHDAIHARRHALAAAYGGFAAAFIANIVFVAAGRTALLTIPVLIALLAIKCFRWKGVCAVAAGTLVLAGVLWMSSDYLRERLGNLTDEVRMYQADNRRTSAGERIEFWKKSISFSAKAPLFGHGTGSTRSLFASVASDGEGASSLISTNPHNQFLAVAVQIGLLGGFLLVAMWIAHAMLFRGHGLVAWTGLVIVTQNVVGSLFNSHLFDFGQGWLYVFGVGVAGGLMMAKRDLASAPVESSLEAPAPA
jgi:O-antigen ligase